MKSKIKNIIVVFLLLLCSIIIVGSIYYYKSYTRQDFDAILYVLTVGSEKTSPDVISTILSTCIPYLIIVIVALIIPIINTQKSKICMNLRFKNKSSNIQLFPIKLTVKHRLLYTIFILIISLSILVKCFGIDDYIKKKLQITKIFETYYINAQGVNIQFPKEKRNLILIIGESFETTVLSQKNGGAWDYSLMPELEDIALKNTSFSNTNKLGGAVQTHGTTYSAGGNVAITSGIPLKTATFINNENNYQGNR